ncbi:MAG TPA: chemotaxis-specific protein-glutamate methyltransferase CheB [Polyangia bacterium]|jgi:two-component system chemotaxis response regulator CheB|nr:chemotaxis-specific protein-glutamate methyltransferase CheB [Polyangia bacterium]
MANMTDKVRVLVVEDSLTVRRRLCDVLSGDPEIEVVGEAENGQAAIELCDKLRPSVITLDMILPVMSGLAATEYVMAHFPTPILVVSASFNRGEVFKTFDALAAGAVDVLEKPRGDEPDGQWERTFLSTVKMVSRIKVITHLRARLGPLGRATRPTPPPLAAGLGALAGGGGKVLRVVAVGASTGGPGALVEVLRALPSSFSLPVLMVLHIDEPFGASFADWLSSQIERSVVYPREGEALAAHAGNVVMAPPGSHLVVDGSRLRLTAAPERHSCRPSVDVLFESLAQEMGPATAAGLLTGMGRDGAAGLLRIRQAGGRTIAQDEATSVVYGMPREAALLGAAEQVLPLPEIGPALLAIVNHLERRLP